MQNPHRTMELSQQEVIGASPIRLVIMAYDLAIRACEEEDFVSSTRAVSVLRDALNYDYREVAKGLFKLYQWCLDCIRKQDFASALVTLRELRWSWAMVEESPVPISSPGIRVNIPAISEVA